MRWYAEMPGRRTRQIVADLVVAAWTWWWWRVGPATHGRTEALAARELRRLGLRGRA